MTEPLPTKTILAAALVMLAGCDEHRPKYENDERRPKYENDERNSVRYDLGDRYYVREFNLRDGTRCLLTPEGGIVCEWRPFEVEL